MIRVDIIPILLGTHLMVSLEAVQKVGKGPIISIKCYIMASPLEVKAKTSPTLCSVSFSGQTGQFEKELHCAPWKYSRNFRSLLKK